MRTSTLSILWGVCCIGLAACAASPSPSSPGDAGGSTPDTSAVDQPSSTGPDVQPADDVGNVTPDTSQESPAGADLGPGDVGPVIPDADQKGVTVAGSGFSAQAGRPVTAAVADDKGAVLARMAGLVGADGSFTVVVPAMLTAGRMYNVAYYVDANANGFCNAPRLDVSGLAPLAAIAADGRISVLASAAPAPVCSYFGDFSYNFDSKAGLVEGHPGHNAYGVIADLADNTIVGELKYGLVDSKGELVLKWPTILVKGHRYNFVLWTDDNGDGVCGMDKKFIYKAAARPGADPINNSALDVTAVPVTGDIDETFPYHHETAQLGASFCQQYFPNPKYP
jgi:hypothetical protein